MAFSTPNPGRMRWRVTIAKDTTDTLDADGYPAAGMQTICEGRAARIEAGYGFDTAQRDEAQHVQQRTVTMRYLAGVDETCRVYIHGDGDKAQDRAWWKVIGLYDPTGSKSWLSVTIERVVAQ